jgi:hypothetical protein
LKRSSGKSILGEVERLAMLGLRPDDIHTLLDLDPRSDKGFEEIVQAMKADRERGKKEVEECLAKLCAEGNREALALVEQDSRRESAAPDVKTSSARAVSSNRSLPNKPPMRARAGSSKPTARAVAHNQ